MSKSTNFNCRCPTVVGSCQHTYALDIGNGSRGKNSHEDGEEQKDSDEAWWIFESDVWVILTRGRLTKSARH